MNNWRLINNLLALVTDSKEVYLVSPEKKSYKTLVGKSIKDSYKEFDLLDEKFKLKVNEDLSISLKNDSLGSDWLKIGNFDNSQLGNLIVNAQNINGEFSEEFEVSISDDFLGIVRFMSPSMSTYKEALNELTRRINCEMYKKTKTFIPGHRYDSVNESIYYLGTVCSKVSPDGASIIEFESVMPVKHMYVSNLKDDEKSISDVLKNRMIGLQDDDIKITASLSSMADLGEVLKNDYSKNYSDYLPDLISKSVESGNLWNLITSLKLGPEYTISSESLNVINDYLHKIAFETATKTPTTSYVQGIGRLRLQDILTKDKELLTEEEKFNIQYLVIRESFLNSQLTCSAEKIKKFIEVKLSILKSYGIDFENICLDEFKKWYDIDTDITKNFNFEAYLEYSDKYHFRDNRAGYVYYDYAIHDLGCLGFGKELNEIIIEIAKTHFDDSTPKVNIGTKKKPKYSYRFTITLEDIVKYAKSNSKLTKTLKNEIVLTKYYSQSFDCLKI